jgi:hypothetical protein
VQLSRVPNDFPKDEPDPLEPPMSDSDDEYLPSDDEEIDVVADDERGADYVDFDEEDFVFLEAEVDLPPPTETEALALAHEYALCSDESDAGAPEAMETNLVQFSYNFHVGVSCVRYNSARCQLYKACVEGNATDAQALLAVGALPDAPSTDPSEVWITPLFLSGCGHARGLFPRMFWRNAAGWQDTAYRRGLSRLPAACAAVVATELQSFG